VLRPVVRFDEPGAAHETRVVSALLDHFDGAVVVAMVAVGVVEVAADEVVDMTAVRNRLVSAVLPLLVVDLVLGAGVVGV
jgi:hypothetical protein